MPKHSNDYLQLVDTLKLISEEFYRAQELCMSIMEAMACTLYPDSEYMARLKGEAAAYERAAAKIDAAIGAGTEEK